MAMRPTSWAGVLPHGRVGSEARLDLLDDPDDKLSVGSSSDGKQSVEVESPAMEQAANVERVSMGDKMPTKPLDAYMA